MDWTRVQKQDNIMDYIDDNMDRYTWDWYGWVITALAMVIVALASR